MQHVDRIGERIMEVDHHNPTHKRDQVHKYSNLFPACRMCNGAKSDTWPTEEDREMGLRFLNPRKEQDYGVHIFEDPKTHELIGKTPAGIYHIENCDLNNPVLTQERAHRHKMRLFMECSVIQKRVIPDTDDFVNGIDSLLEQIKLMIPPIPFDESKEGA